MQINSIQTAFQDKENRTKAKYIGAATILSAGSAFIATKPARGAMASIKTSSRILKAGLAGVIAAGITTLLSMKKEDFILIKDKVAGMINKNPKPIGNAVETTQEAPATGLTVQENITEKEPEAIPVAAKTSTEENAPVPQMAQTITDTEAPSVVKGDNQIMQNPFATFKTTAQG